MRANLLTAAVAAGAALAMNSIYCGSISGAWFWVALQAPTLLGRIAWQDCTWVLGAVHACDCFGTMLLMTMIAALARR
jgi:hypothetical protein